VSIDAMVAAAPDDASAWVGAKETALVLSLKVKWGEPKTEADVASDSLVKR